MQRVPGEEELSAMERRWGEEADELAAKMRPFGLVLTPSINQRIQRYCELVVMWNRRQSLLSRQDVGNVLHKHVGASLGALLLVIPNAKERWVDVGTGAGLPGLILKVWEPAQEIVLVEGSRKKGVFLESVVRELDLGAVDIQTARIETLLAKGSMRERFHVLFVRAVADLKTTLRAFGPVLQPGGRVVTYKGPSWGEDVENAIEDGILAPGAFALEQVLCVPWAPGHLLLLRKDS